MLRTDQDRSLDALTVAISRQRDLSLHISSELETQEALLEDLDHGLDRTGSRLNRASGRLDRFARKARENGAMCTIVGLIVLLLVRRLPCKRVISSRLQRLVRLTDPHHPAQMSCSLRRRRYMPFLRFSLPRRTSVPSAALALSFRTSCRLRLVLPAAACFA